MTALLKNTKDMSLTDLLKYRDEMSDDIVVELNDRFQSIYYKHLPFVARTAKGVFIYDTTDQKYYDFVGAFGAANQGHCHPLVVEAMKGQLERMTLCSRAFHSDMLSLFCKFTSDYFGYKRVLPMNSGVEAVESAVKLCRKWGYNIKGIPELKAKIIFPEKNFWGRTVSAISTSQNALYRDGFGPFTPGFVIIPYNDLNALRETLENDANICAFIMEPIQGEAGVIVPDDGYLRGAHDLCKKHNVLFVVDEIQTGLGRTGKLLCVDHENVRPDVICLGKSLASGAYPVSAVLADDEVMMSMGSGQHGSTYGGNPLGCAAAIASLCALRDEKMSENAEKVGAIFRDEVSALIKELPWIKSVRGKGLMNAVEVHTGLKHSAWELCVELAKHGILCKPTHVYTIRFTPPIIITEEQMRDAVSRITTVFMSFKDKM